MTRKFFGAAIAMVLSAGLAAGCSDDGETTNNNPDGPTAVLINQCTSYVDHTSASTVSITFPVGTPFKFSDPCIKIKAGRTVVFTGSFTSHPLNAFNGDSPTPIQHMTSGVSASFTFNNPGTFGFHCENHPSSMLGAIQVVP